MRLCLVFFSRLSLSVVRRYSAASIKVCSRHTNRTVGAITAEKFEETSGGGTVIDPLPIPPPSLPISCYYIHLCSHKLQLQKQEIYKKNKENTDTQRVKEHNVSNAY